MKIQGTKTDFVEIDVDIKTLVNSIVSELYKQLPPDLRQHNEVYFRDSKLYVCDEVLGHTRDWEENLVSELYPKLVLTQQHVKIIEMISDLPKLLISTK